MFACSSSAILRFIVGCAAYLYMYSGRWGTWSVGKGCNVVLQASAASSFSPSVTASARSACHMLTKNKWCGRTLIMCLAQKFSPIATVNLLGTVITNQRWARSQDEDELEQEEEQVRSQQRRWLQRRCRRAAVGVLHTVLPECTHTSVSGSCCLGGT